MIWIFQTLYFSGNITLEMIDYTSPKFRARGRSRYYQTTVHAAEESRKILILFNI